MTTTPTESSPAGRPWALGADAVLALVGGARGGLTAEEAARRLERHGPNALEQAGGASRAAILLRQFTSPLIYILLLAAAVTLALGEYADAGVIGAVLVFNAVVGFVQEDRAERSIEALRRLATTRTRVLRDRREVDVDATHLVSGDVVLLEAGAKVPADCRVLHETALECDESALTGESEPVAKDAAPVAPGAPLAERACMLYMGTVATRGHGRALVVATGADTELGRIAGTVQEIAPARTPLQERMGRFTRLIGTAAIAGSALGFLLGLAAGEDAHELFLTMVALAVAALPEGLPIVLTVALAISVSRMAARRALVRRLPAVETLGSCTVIGSDKTGTLTQNRMTVERIYAGGEEYAVTGRGYAREGGLLRGTTPVRPQPGSALHRTLLAGVLCNEASVVEPEADRELEVAGDPTEVALLVAGAKAGLWRDELDDDLPRAGDIPFDPHHRFAATYHHAGDGGTLLLVKGAPERVLELCATDAGGGPLDRDAIEDRAHALAAQGMRVLAMAGAELDHRVDGTALPAPDGLAFYGLQAMMDPPRDEARAAVADCRRAGIRPLMITGDHAVTALAIARELGIAGPDDRVVGGPELDALGDAELTARVREASVFARISPAGKLRIVEALRRGGEVVAVTGDGVNDAPALKAADIGVAMGRSGTDVAKEAAEMIVTDDDFATIVGAVEEGRVAFDNVRKTTFFLVSGNAAAVLAVLASLVLGLPLPFVAAQLLWLNLVTNGVQDVALAFEPGEPDVLDRRPRPRREGIVSPLLWERTLLSAVVMAAGTLLLFVQQDPDGGDLRYAQTVALTTMVVFQALHVGNARSERRSALAKSPFSNRFLLLGTVGALAIHVAALHIPFTQEVLRVEPLGAAEWLRIVLVALSVVVAVELHKLVRRPARG